jgi:hypothetical protein
VQKRVIFTNLMACPDPDPYFQMIHADSDLEHCICTYNIPPRLHVAGKAHTLSFYLFAYNHAVYLSNNFCICLPPELPVR